MKPVSLFAAAFALTLVSACTDRSTPTEPVAPSTPEATAPETPASDTSDTEAQAGAPDASLKLVQILSADDMAGRLAGSDGGAMARDYLADQMTLRGLTVIEQAFSFESREGESVDGINLIARIDGKTDGPAMIVTAHYDHVGTRDGEIYNGADDNASGVAGALAVADHFLSDQPEYDVVIALLDAEEMGLQGARALVRDGLPDGGDMAFNLNFDMLSKNDKNELYASGSYHNPQLVPLLTAVAEDAPVSLKLGHDQPEQGPDDWTNQSDHAVFHNAGIPFIYFGVEDHPEYHQPTDVFQSIPQDFFLRSIETVVMAAEAIDAELATVTARTETED